MPTNPAVIVGVVASLAAAAGITAAILAFVLSRKKPQHTLMDPNSKVPLKIIDRQFITHDTMRLKLALPTPKHVLGLPVGNHVYLSSRIDGSLVVRPYTPVSLDSLPGYVDFIIKVYRAGTNSSFPHGGKMSQYLGNIPINNFVDVRGPGGNLEYKGSGIFHIKPDARSTPVPYNAKRVSMVCGGSGITPMFQLLSYILKSPKDTTSVSLIFANVTVKDIILRDELDILRDEYKDQFRLWYTVNEASENWNYSTGYIDEKMLQEHTFPPGDDSLVLVCGPPPMVEFACLPNLAKVGHSRDRIYVF